MWNGLRQSSVSSLVSSFSSQLTLLAADVRHLLHCPVADRVRAALAQQSQAGGGFAGGIGKGGVGGWGEGVGGGAGRWPYDFLPLLSLPRFLDEELLPSLHRLYAASVQALAEQLKRRLSSLEHGVLAAMATAEGWRSPDCARLVQQAVFIGRCCHQITQQSSFTSFSTLLSNDPPTSSTALIGGGGGEGGRGGRGGGGWGGGAVAVAPSVASVAISSALASTTRSAFRIWGRYVAATLSEEVGGGAESVDGALQRRRRGKRRG